MKILVTGSSGHLGEALVRTLRNEKREVIGVDIVPSEFTNQVGSIVDRQFVKLCTEGVGAVIHTATLHKPHVVTHSRQSFVDTNITGTLNLLEEAAMAGVGSFVLTSTTSAFGCALSPPSGSPAAWVTEDVTPVPRNIYGVTKTAAENFCELFHRKLGLACLILRTSRFFPEEDDREETRKAYDDDNIKVNEFLYRRVDLEDVVSAHLLAIEKAPIIGFGRYIVSATTPFSQDDLFDLRANAPLALKRRVPDYEAEYARRRWKMFPGIDRVYVNQRARNDLGWRPRYDFRYVLDTLSAGSDPRSPLSRTVGSKGYHSRKFAAAPYPAADFEVSSPVGADTSYTPYGTYTTIPSGTQLAIRTNEVIDSAKSVSGQNFSAVMYADAVDSSGAIAIRKGSDVELAIRSTTGSDLMLDIDSVTVGGQRYVVSASDLKQKGGEGIGANRRTAEMVGGGAAVGAVIGAIVGGGKGAAIGAGVGAAGGAGVVVLTKGKAVRVPAETILTFKLDADLRLQPAR